MNVAIVTNLFPPIQTGSAFWARELATYLARAGDRVVVITCGLASKPVVEEQGEVVVYRLPAVHHLARAGMFLNFDQFYLCWSPRNLGHVLSILREHRVDLVHQCGQLLDSMVLTVQACRKLDIPSLCSVHTRLFHPSNWLYNSIFGVVDRLAIARLVRSFDSVIALDKVIADYVDAVYRPQRMDILPVCIDGKVLQQEAADPSAPGPVRIVSLGHVTEMRSRKELLEALAEHRLAGLDVRLTIAGKVLTSRTGSMIDALGLAGAVELLGEVRRDPDLFDLLRSSHIEAHWLDMPGIGSAAVEAMALGLPVVTYGHEGIYGDVPLRHGENIMFIDPARPATIREALLALIESPALRGSIGQRARRLVREHLTWDTMIKRVRAIYGQVLALKSAASLTPRVAT